MCLMGPNPRVLTARRHADRANSAAIGAGHRHSPSTARPKRRLHVFGRPVERGHRLQFVARLMIVALELTVDGVVLFPLARDYAGPPHHWPTALYHPDTNPPANP